MTGEALDGLPHAEVTREQAAVPSLPVVSLAKSRSARCLLFFYGVQLTRVFSMRSDVRSWEDSVKPPIFEEREDGDRSSSCVLVVSS
jgi:hypothetical protein